MQIIDCIVIFIIAVFFILAVISIRKNKGGCGCNCQGCNKNCKK